MYIYVYHKLLKYFKYLLILILTNKKYYIKNKINNDKFMSFIVNLFNNKVCYLV